jgi:group I intron endonuclease
MKSGVYKILNKETDKIYVGSSATKKGIPARWNHHKYQLRNNKHHSVYLQRAWNKYGEESFELQVIEYCKPEDCLAIEQFWLETLNPDYNISFTAGNNYGYKHSKESRKKMSEAKKGKTAWNKGKKIGNNYKKDSFYKRQKTMEKNNCFSGKPRIKIKVTDSQGKTVVYNSISETGKNLGISSDKIGYYSKKSRNYKGYNFTRVKNDN